MSTTPPEQGPPIPPVHEPGEYIPFKDRDPNAPPPAWLDPAAQSQQGGRRMTHEEHYRAIYGYDAPGRITYASWGRRVLGYLVDTFFGAVASIPLIVGYWMLLSEIETTTDSYGNQVMSDTTDISPATVGVLVLGAVISLAFTIWNVAIRQGRTGYTLGKTVVGIRLVGATSEQPLGAGMAFLRQLAHFVDSFVCYLGWLWPLWDARRQTFADKIVGSVVVILPQDQVQS
jgi:uncharacterized RDD family membrane protein YckC